MAKDLESLQTMQVLSRQPMTRKMKTRGASKKKESIDQELVQYILYPFFPKKNVTSVLWNSY